MQVGDTVNSEIGYLRKIGIKVISLYKRRAYFICQIREDGVLVAFNESELRKLNKEDLSAHIFGHQRSQFKYAKAILTERCK